MILEALVTTIGLDGRLNIAPMGPEVEPGEIDRFVLKPFKTATTYRNLIEGKEGVLHVTDDVLLIARAAIGRVENAPTRPADVVRGEILLSAARYYEFQVTSVDDSGDRARISVEVVAEGRQGDLFGLNRGKYAVVEAAILATRLDFLPRDEVFAEFAKLERLVEKTGGRDERSAFALLKEYVNLSVPLERPSE